MEENIPTPKDLFSVVVNGVDGSFACCRKYFSIGITNLKKSSYHQFVHFMYVIHAVECVQSTM